MSVRSASRPWTAFVWCIAVLACLPWAAVQAASGRGVLTLTNGQDVLELSIDDLEGMPQHTITTINEFTDRPVTYRGPLARAVLSYLDLDSVEVVRLTALNDYFIEIPTRDFLDYDVIMAIEADGVPLSRRDKGPIWLMYPISDHSELTDPRYNARLIWQLDRVEAR
jgi:hypothetical protein